MTGDQARQADAARLKARRRLRRRLAQVVLYAIATVVSVVFLYPYYWMLVSSFRSTEAILTNPLRLFPETIDLTAFSDISRTGGVDLWVYAANSVFITVASTAIAVLIAAFGAYSLVRKPDLPGFRIIRFGFLLTIMYPYMLLVIPVYIVMYYLGLLGTYTGIILFLSLGPIQFFLFEQFFRSIPRELIEAARVDGASETQTLLRIVMPMAWPVVAMVTLVTFLLNWSQWFPILVISRSPHSYTLPVALLSLNSELGTNFQGIMALATLTTVPVVIVFLFAQRRVMEGITAGAVKG